MMIQSIMLVTLGFLAASLLALILAPALWKRAVRLTTDRIRIGMPIKLSEIHADKDQLRAEFAIKISKYEAELEKANTAAAKQLVEFSRRDAEIKKLEAKIAEISKNLEEQQNANRVYEQTIALRIPKMEAQLHKAKEILGARYQEITQLRTTLSAQEGKLGQAQTRDQMRKAELERLKLALDQSVKSDNLGEAVKFVPHAKYEQLHSKNRELEEQITKLRVDFDSSDKKKSDKPAFFKSEIKSFAQRIASMTAASEPNGEDVVEPVQEAGEKEISEEAIDQSAVDEGDVALVETDEAIVADGVAHREDAQADDVASEEEVALIEEDLFIEEVASLGGTENQGREEEGAQVLEMKSEETRLDDETLSDDLDEEPASNQGSSNFMEELESTSDDSDAESERVALKSERPSLKRLRLSDRLKILQGSN